jgi:glucose/arabinose dehydrogenase
MRRAWRFLLLSFLSFGLAVRINAERHLPLDQIKLPPGFRIALYTDQVPEARSMAVTPDGTVFVGTKGGNVYALTNPHHGPKADEAVVVARGLRAPTGVAFRNGALYVAEVSHIWRYDDIERNLKAPHRPVLVTQELPSEEAHAFRIIHFGPDDWLYFGIGVPCNICEKPDPYGTIMRVHPDGSGMEVYARGVRNTVGFDWDPVSHDLWFTDNGRDWMGDEAPPDELNHAPKPGMNFGYPYCHGGTISDPEFGKKHPCSQFTPPEKNLGPHVASLGMRFYTGAMFPSNYRNQIFIAEHGSWNRSHKIGYRVTLVTLDHGRTVSYRPFAEGWLQGETAWGRPVDVLVMPDGALLVSDDSAGVIYRISFQK